MKNIGFNLLSFGTLCILLSVTPSILLAQKKSLQSKSSHPCELGLSQSPKLRGLYLGESKEELFITLPMLETLYSASENNGFENKKVGYVGLNYVFGRDLPDGFKDVNLMIQFLDGKISYISVDYEQYEPTNLQMFIVQAADTTGLPKDGWKSISKYSAEMKCSDFLAELWTGREEARSYYKAYPNFRLTDLTAELELEKRRKEIQRVEIEKQKEKKRVEIERKQNEEKQRRIFKP